MTNLRTSKIRNLLPAPVRRALRGIADRRFNRLDIETTKLGIGGGAWQCFPPAFGPSPEVLSGGVGKDVSFEIELVSRFGARVAMFDPSPTGRETVTSMGDLPDGLRFFELGLAGESGAASFNPPSLASEGSYRLASSADAPMSFPCADPLHALRIAGFQTPAVLKLDIEGFEYQFLHRMLRQGIRPGQIAVEFHHFLPGIPRSLTRAAVRDLKAVGYLPIRKRGSDWLFVLRSLLT